MRTNVVRVDKTELKKEITDEFSDTLENLSKGIDREELREIAGDKAELVSLKVERKCREKWKEKTEKELKEAELMGLNPEIEG